MTRESFQPLESARRRVTLDCTDSPTRTEQAHKDECCVQNILKKYRATGRLEHTAKYEGTYGDFANAPSYSEAQNIIANAKSMFETVPASIRQDFDNDPQKFVDFMQDPSKSEEIEAYGLSTSHLPPWDKPASNPSPSPSQQPETPPEATPEPSA